MKKSSSYEKELLKQLKNRDEAIAYLNAALEEDNREAFLLALSHVIQAQSSFSSIAKKTKLNREGLSKLLTGSENPKINGLFSLLGALGLKIQVAQD